MSNGTPSEAGLLSGLRDIDLGSFFGGMTPGGGFQTFKTLSDALSAGTVGVLWSGVTGTVDPWSKAGQISEQAAAYTRAGMDPRSAEAQAESDVTNALRAAGADPEQIPDYMKQLGDLLTIALILGVIYLGAQVFIVGKAWKEVLSP